MRLARLAAPLVLLILTTAAAACGTPQSATSAASTSGPSFNVPAATPTASAAPATTAQSAEDAAVFGPRTELPGGLLLKQLGKVAQYGSPTDSDPNHWVVRLVVDSITVDPRCDQYVGKPDRGHRLVVALRVETSPRFDPNRDSAPYSGAFSTVGTDDVSEASLFSPECHTTAALPGQLRPAAKYRGELTVDTANAVGQLVYSNMYVWKYPNA